MAATACTSGSRSGEARRLTYLDGLRGLAVLMVLVFHAWMLGLSQVGGAFQLHRMATATPANFLAAMGYQGVSLFLVISGFCLSYPALLGRTRGEHDWFSARRFLVERWLRIAPPYYAALLLFTLVPGLLSTPALERMKWWVSPHPGILDVTLHLLLLHNLLPQFAFSINGAFWSLGLEWQWYCVFPLFLLLVLRWPFKTLLAVLVTGLACRIVFHVYLYDAWSAYTGGYLLPDRLFEFCCGIAGAKIVVDRVRIRVPWLVVAVVLSVGLGCLARAELAGLPVLQNAHPLWGVAFMSLLLLGHDLPRLNAALSLRPLARLGAVSYSVYLVHQPVMMMVETLSPAWVRASALQAPLGIAAGLGAGFLFYHLVEGPCMAYRARVLHRQPRAGRGPGALPDHVWRTHDRGQRATIG